MTKIYDDIINEIENLRRINNSNWMGLLRLALESSPEKAKRILKDINYRDERISELMTKLGETSE